jgi:ParB family chromosome partitioning protein
VGPDGCHELIAGERRWRAARQAGLSSIPCIVRDVDEQTAAELGIVENVQREDLDAIEKADAFQRLQAEFGLTHQEIADRVGWTRAAVTNQIRLCDLDAESGGLVLCGDLSGGHARVLLSVAEIEHRVAMAKQAIADGWSVREMERRVRAVAERGGSTTSTKSKETPRRAHLDDLETQLSDYLGTRVRIAANRAGNKGKLQIEFYDLDQFDGLLQRFGFKLR